MNRDALLAIVTVTALMAVMTLVGMSGLPRPVTAENASPIRGDATATTPAHVTQANAPPITAPAAPANTPPAGHPLQSMRAAAVE